MKAVAARKLLAVLAAFAWSCAGVMDVPSSVAAGAVHGQACTAFLSDENVEREPWSTVARRSPPAWLAAKIGGPATGGSSIGCGSACDDAFCGDGMWIDECCGGWGICDVCGSTARRSYYAEAQFLWLRAHLMEDALGKLAEQYEFSPRLVVGYDGGTAVGGRVRYWHYGHQTPFVGQGDGIRFQFDVSDLEATRRFTWQGTDLVVASGLRLAHVEVVHDDRLNHILMPGITLAADIRSVLGGGCGWECAAVAGGRLSILGGDWKGSELGLIGNARDDNVVARELYSGIELLRRQARYDLFVRATFEIQNWRSDAAAHNADFGSIGMIGPGFHLGIAL